MFYSLIFLNSMVYALMLVFFFIVFFLFDFRVFRTLSEYKFFKLTSFFNTTLVIIFFSFAGIPPFLGFLTKILLFAAIFFSNHIFFAILFVFLNLFFIFFYIQNVRFLFSNTYVNFYLYRNYKSYLNFSLISVLVFLNFFNVAAILFFDYLLIWISQFIFFVNFY